MKNHHALQEAPAKEGKQAVEIAMQDMLDAEIVMLSSFLQEGEIVGKAAESFILLDLSLHTRQIRRQFHMRAVLEVYIVVWFAFPYIDTFSFQRCSQIVESLFKQLGQQKQTRALIKAITVLLDQRAATARVSFFLENSHIVACLGESSCYRNSANTTAFPSQMRYFSYRFPAS